MTTRPPLVAHVLHRLDFGGLENGVVNLVNRMPADRYRHAIICLVDFNPEFRSRIEPTDVEVVSLHKRPGKDPAAYLRMWRTLRHLEPTVVHTRNLGTVDMQWVALAAGVPHRVHGEHGWEAADLRGSNRRNLLIRRACRPVIDMYVPMSKDLANWLAAGVGVRSHRLRQIYSGVDTERFHPRPPPCAGGSSRAAGFVVGTIGRLDPVKDHASLIQAFASIRVQYPGARLLIIGDGPLRPYLEQLAASLQVSGAVTFTGARNDTPELLRQMDVFVLPSLNEGISNTILEAMATGLPVVARSVGGNPEIVIDDTTGTLYDGRSAEALPGALSRYLSDPALRAMHGRAARDRVVQDFSLKAMVQRYASLYDELLHRPRLASHRRERNGIGAF